MPKTHFEVDGDQASTTIYVTWRDKRGEEAGIFPIRFDPDGELKSGQKSILKDTTSSWIAFRDYNGLLVYFTHLMSYRCAIKSLRYGLDGAPPDTPYALPPCDPDNPYALPDDVLPYEKLPGGTKSMSLVVEFFDGEPILARPAGRLQQVGVEQVGLAEAPQRVFGLGEGVEPGRGEREDVDLAQLERAAQQRKVLLEAREDLRPVGARAGGGRLSV